MKAVDSDELYHQYDVTKYLIPKRGKSSRSDREWNRLVFNFWLLLWNAKEPRKQWVSHSFGLVPYRNSFVNYNNVISMLEYKKNWNNLYVFTPDNPVYPRGHLSEVLDCGLEVNEFELQSCYSVHFRTNTIEESKNPLILTSQQLKSIAVIFLQELIWH